MSESSLPSTAVSQQLDAEQFDWFLAVGGWRGIIESMLPVSVFLVVYSLTLNVWGPAIAAGVLSALFIVGRLIMRVPVAPAVSGFIVTGLSVLAAVWSGRGENYFLIGLAFTTLLALVLIGSILARQPAAAHAVTMAWTLPHGWMRTDTYSGLYARCITVTGLWATLLVVRLTVQVPLWYWGNVEGLATAKLVMGLPLLAIVVWASWMLLRPYHHLKNHALGEQENSAQG